MPGGEGCEIVTTTGSPTPETGDFGIDIGGVVGVRVRDARVADLAVVRRQLGTLNRPLAAPHRADIEIRFVDRPAPDDLHLIGTDGGFSENSFFLWADEAVAVSMGPELPIRLEVSRGTRSIPRLVDLVSAAALLKGYIPLHASCFRWAGRGVLLAGWAKGGKTEALLAFMERGAVYVGDEWLFMPPDETEVSGIPEPMRIWDWHLDELPHLRRRLGRRAEARQALLRGVERLLERAGDRPAAARWAGLVNRQRYVRIDPARAFGEGRCVIGSPVELLFLMVSSRSAAVTVEPVDADRAARRLAASTAFEHLRLVGTELEQQFAFPDRATPFWDALRLTTETLEKRIADLTVYQVSHPHPAPTAALFRAMRPVVEEEGR